jgi:hypothetical protein
MTAEQGRQYNRAVFIPDVVRHVGHYCQVTTQNRQFFGELIRLSSCVFGIRLPASGAIARTVDAGEIVAITDLSRPHR